MNRLKRILATSMIALVTLGASHPALAQTPEDGQVPDAATRAQLAAIVPGADDLPVGYTFTGETFLTADQVAAGDIDASALIDAGFITQYVSVYQHAESDSQIRSYVSAWTDAEAADAGFALVEDEAALLPDASLEDSEASVGEEPRETTIGTYSLADGTSIGTADVTFRSDNLIVGIAAEKTDGSEADAELASELAEALAARAESVRSGEAPAGTDLDLPARVLTLADTGSLMQAGFLGSSEVEAVYGVQGSVLGNIDAAWVETVSLGEPVGAAPLITVGLTSFASPEDATATVEQASEIFEPLPNQEQVDATLDGADSVVAYQFAQEEDGDVDSYRLLYAAGTDLVVIDIYGGSSDAVSADTASQIATAQLECQGAGECTAPELPADLVG